MLYEIKLKYLHLSVSTMHNVPEACKGVSRVPTTRRIKDLPKIDRPREKLLRNGARSLSEFELLEVIIASGGRKSTVEQLAAKVQSVLAHDSVHASKETLLNIDGLSEAKVSQLLAAFELVRRYIVQADTPLEGSADYAKVMADIAVKKQEHLVCLSLDGARRLIARRTITVGVLDSVLVHPREVFADAIVDRAAAVVVGHNHPSDVVAPSHFDIGFTQQLIAAARVIGIQLQDHIIISRRGYFSFKDEGLV